MNYCCENCGWSEIVGSPIICNYNGHRTWRNECCEAWKPKEKETNMVEVVLCKDCRHIEHLSYFDNEYGKALICGKHSFEGYRKEDWFCADGERRTDDD